jgi:Flp pilus assembly protein CpaB
MRAITLEVNEFSGVAGLLTPGCHVDVIATINEGGTHGQQVAKTIVQNVKVMAVGQKTSVAGNEPPMPNEMFKSVTVLATLGDAEAIELACSTGRPRLVLRGGRDQEIAASTGITLGELRGSGRDGGFDPFVLPPVAINPTPTTLPAEVSPTTRPTRLETFVRRDSNRRVVKVIKGGVESSVTLNMGGFATDTMVGTDTTDPFGGR